MRIVSIGEILWDVFGAVDHLGEQAFNSPPTRGELGHDVVLLAPSATMRGAAGTGRMAALGLTTTMCKS